MSEQSNDLAPGTWILWANRDRGAQPLGTVLSTDDETVTYQPRFGGPATVKRHEVEAR